MTAAAGLGSVMSAEMAEQPATLRRLLARRAEIEAVLREALPAEVAGVTLLARGSSDNAALFGRYLLEGAVGVPAGLAAPSLWTRYEQRLDLAGHLLIALSQSGRTPEIERVVSLAGAAGAATVAITNEADSPLAQAAGQVVALDAGLELAVPATKTFTAQVAALALLAEGVARGEGGAGAADAVDALPAMQEEVLADGERARQVARLLAEARAVVMVGSGFLYPIAMEAALKLLETTSVPALAYSATDFLHGPLAVAGPDVPVVCFATDGPVREDVEAAARAAVDRGAPLLWVSDRGERIAKAEQLPVPGGLPEHLAGLVHAIRAQQLALETSRRLGRDPDTPQGLRKVTATA